MVCGSASSPVELTRLWLKPLPLQNSVLSVILPSKLTNCSQVFGTKQCHAVKERWSLLNGIAERLKVEKYPAELLWTNFLLDAGPALKLDPALGMARGLRHDLFFLIREDLP